MIDLLPNQDLEKDDVGASMRLGTYPCKLNDDSLAAQIYSDEVIYERHRHRYEVNNKYRDILVENPDHPFFIASQFHPEFKSRPWDPAPLFKEFVLASIKNISIKSENIVSETIKEK